MGHSVVPVWTKSTSMRFSEPSKPGRSMGASTTGATSTGVVETMV